MQNKLLAPQYVKDFSCIGSDCEDSCCIGWKIDIDTDTFKKYKAIKQSHPLKKLLEKNVKKNRSAVTSNSRFAKIKLTKDNRCPILDENNLCSIHSQLGEDYLSSTCKVYPRNINIIDNRTELSLTLSCPEAARLALLNKDIMTFDELEDVDAYRKLAKQQLVTEGKGKGNISYYFWDLRIFTISLLQNRNYSVSDRLILLGMFYNKIQSAISANQLEEIPIIMKETNEKIASVDTKIGLSTIPKTTDIQIKLVKSILSAKSNINSKRFLETISEFTNGLGQVKGEIEEADIVDRFELCYEKFYQPFMKENEYILENYLVNYVFKNMFPFSESDVFKSFCLLTIHFSVIKVLLIGVSGYHESLNNETVIKVIQSFAKGIEHNGPFLKAILKSLDESNYLTMAYMAILVKN